MLNLCARTEEERIKIWIYWENWYGYTMDKTKDLFKVIWTLESLKYWYQEAF